MDYEIVEAEGFKFVGSKLRVLRDREVGLVQNHWQNFFFNMVEQKVRNKENNDFIGLYSNYEKDLEYDLSLGFKVSSFDDNFDCFEKIEVPKQRYAVFKVRGQLPNVLVESWNKIRELGLNRTFKYDFEVFGEKGKNLMDSEFEIYVGIE